MKNSANTIKRLSLELGGKNSFIVLVTKYKQNNRYNN